MNIIKLVRPSKEYKMETLEYKNEFLHSGDQLHGTAGLDRIQDFEDWLSRIEDNSCEETVREGLVPAFSFLAFRESDNKLIGMIDIRHRLNDFLLQFGGHIGFSIRKTERQKGYAKEMLRVALIVCKSLNIKKVLITCDQDNIASAKTIISNGGILENEILDGDHLIQRYWITLEY